MARRRIYKSRGALEAETAGFLPMTRLLKWLRTQDLPGYIVRKNLRRFIQEMIGSGEWHHNGFGARRTNYFNVQEVFDRLQSQEGKEEWDWLFNQENTLTGGIEMSEQKHTWKAVPYGEGDGAIVVHDEDDSQIAQFHVYPVAEARLIAAAPDLLEACHDALGFASWESLARWVEPGTSLKARLEAAIAKATGEEQT